MSQGELPSAFAESILLACRDYLHECDVPADEVPDDEVIARAKIRLISCCRLFPGSWDKRFARQVSAWPSDRPLSEKQLVMIEKLWIKYRAQLRGFSQRRWPGGLPRPPKDRPGGNGWREQQAVQRELEDLVFEDQGDEP